ncbi:MAG: two-component system, chemotaxis family, sensor kinase CheA [Frankiaceae bacterium]|jgi:chemotaxis protein histidine kinase CheA|nr:two-component system, chemotaxis family, sensor kinase CheA [Frankiaceae bacterium]
MADWGNDPELMATFRAEVEDRLASMSNGLLTLESTPQAKKVIGSLFRDAHTVKGSARMLGLDAVVAVAHHMEDLLGALKDGRFGVRRDLIDLLLASGDAVGLSLPGAPNPSSPAHLDALVAALQSALNGDDPVAVPVPPAVVAAAVAETDEADEPELPRGPDGNESIRIVASKVYDLIDVVGEAALGARRVEDTTTLLTTLVNDHARWTKLLRKAAGSSDAALPEPVELAVGRLLALGDQIQAATAQMREHVETHTGRVDQVRDGAMGLAMVPLQRVLAGFPRLVREVATATDKDVRLEIVGEDVELDKQVLDGIADALKHLVTNAVDHGCDTVLERIAAGKPAQATVRVSARAAGGHIVIEVSEDGRGINEDAVRAAAIERGLLPSTSGMAGAPLLALLFEPAFSTRKDITATSGRGVGLDVVKEAVDDLGGTVAIHTRLGEGTTFTLQLPVTLGVMRCLVTRLGGERFAIPVNGVVETLSLKSTPVSNLAGVPVIRRHGATLPLLDLGVALDVPGDRVSNTALIVRIGDRQVAWAVDRMEGELELVVKDLGSYLRRVPGVSGATIAGDGAVMLLLDLRDIAERTIGGVRHQVASVPTLGSGPKVKKARILIVEDSIGVRELERVILQGAGYEVETAIDGLDGAAKLRGELADLVVSDVEMPGMDGFTLTRTIRRTRGWEQVPVILMTSRNDDADKRAGLEAGASAYLFKQDFDQHELIDTVRRLIGR